MEQLPFYTLVPGEVVLHMFMLWLQVTSSNDCVTGGLFNRSYLSFALLIL